MNRDFVSLSTSDFVVISGFRSPQKSENAFIWLQKGEYGTFAHKEAKVVLDSWRDSADEKDVAYLRWNTTTARLAESATLAFLFLQLPQIILNTQNLLAGDFSALFAVPWMVLNLHLPHNIANLELFLVR